MFILFTEAPLPMNHLRIMSIAFFIWLFFIVQEIWSSTSIDRRSSDNYFDWRFFLSIEEVILLAIDRANSIGSKDKLYRIICDIKAIHVTLLNPIFVTVNFEICLSFSQKKKYKCRKRFFSLDITKSKWNFIYLFYFLSSLQNFYMNTNLEWCLLISNFNH